MKKGFTLIELLVAISIIGILSTIGIITYSGAQAKARDAIRKADLGKLVLALEGYFQKNGGYIESENQRCNSHDIETFYKDIAPYMAGGVAPEDPKKQKYCYFSENSGQSFRLFAKLEDPVDSEVISCQPPDYNYTITSENLTPKCP